MLLHIAAYPSGRHVGVHGLIPLFEPDFVVIGAGISGRVRNRHRQALVKIVFIGITVGTHAELGQGVNEFGDGRGKGPVGGGVVIGHRIRTIRARPGGRGKEFEAFEPQGAVGGFGVGVLLVFVTMLFLRFKIGIDAIVFLCGVIVNLLAQGFQRIGRRLAFGVADFLLHLLIDLARLVAVFGGNGLLGVDALLDFGKRPTAADAYQHQGHNTCLKNGAELSAITRHTVLLFVVVIHHLCNPGLYVRSLHKGSGRMYLFTLCDKMRIYYSDLSAACAYL